MLGLLLIVISCTFYTLQIFLFHSPRDTFFYLFQDIAFVPFQVIMVTLVLEGILSIREKQERLRKINMVISAFYSEIGTSMITRMFDFIINFSLLKKRLDIGSEWTDIDFKNAVKFIDQFDFEVECSVTNLALLNDYLFEKRDYFVGMLKSQTLMEHDTLTDMIWAIYHVFDELRSRESLESLPNADINHLSNDIKRGFKLLIIEWMYYMNYLRKEYPYLYSLARRKNPFSDCSVIVK